MQGIRLSLLRDLLIKSGWIQESQNIIHVKDVVKAFPAITILDERTLNKRFSYSDPLIDKLKAELSEGPEYFIYKGKMSKNDAEDLLNSYSISIPHGFPSQYYPWLLFVFAIEAGPKLVNRDKRLRPCAHYIDRPHYDSLIKQSIILGSKCIMIGLAGSGRSQLVKKYLSLSDSIPTITKICNMRIDDTASTFNSVISKHICKPIIINLPEYLNKEYMIEYSENALFNEPDCLYIVRTSNLNPDCLADIKSVHLNNQSILLVVSDSADPSIIESINNPSTSANKPNALKFIPVFSDFYFLRKVYDHITSEAKDSSIIALSDNQKKSLFIYCNGIPLVVSAIAYSLKEYVRNHTPEQCKSQIDRVLNPYSGLFRTSGLSPIKDHDHSSKKALKTFLHDALTPFIDAHKEYSEQFSILCLLVRGSRQSISLIENISKTEHIMDAALLLNNMGLAAIDTNDFICISYIISDLIWNTVYHDNMENVQARCIRDDVTERMSVTIKEFLSLFEGHKDTPITDYFTRDCYDSARSILVRIKNERPYISKTNPSSKWDNIWCYYDQIRSLLMKSGDYLDSNEINDMYYMAESKNENIDLSNEEQKNNRDVYHIKNMLLSGERTDCDNNKFIENLLNGDPAMLLDYLINKIDTIGLFNIVGDHSLMRISPESLDLEKILDSLYQLTAYLNNDFKTTHESEIIFNKDTTHWQAYYQCVLGCQKYLYCQLSGTIIPDIIIERTLLRYKRQLLDITNNDSVCDSLRIRAAADLYRYLGLSLIKYGENKHITYEETCGEYLHHLECITQRINKSFLPFSVLQTVNKSLVIFHILTMDKSNLKYSLGFIQKVIEDRYNPINSDIYKETLNTINECLKKYTPSEPI